jgi:hypothetical protein
MPGRDAGEVEGGGAFVWSGFVCVRPCFADPPAEKQTFRAEPGKGKDGGYIDTPDR